MCLLGAFASMFSKGKGDSGAKPSYGGNPANGPRNPAMSGNPAQYPMGPTPQGPPPMGPPPGQRPYN